MNASMHPQTPGAATTRRVPRTPGTLRTPLAAAGWLLCALLVTACGRPPHKGPGDQIPDVNEALTRQKDARWAQYVWPIVDNAMRNGAHDGAFPAPAPETLPGGCAVGLAENGQIVYLGTYGEASPGNAWELHTQAPVGSVAKTLTAIAAMRLTARTAPSGAPYLQLFETVGEHLSTSNSALYLTPSPACSTTPRAPVARRPAAHPGPATFSPAWIRTTRPGARGCRARLSNPGSLSPITNPTCR
jgi:hypothetical protein